MRYIDVRGTKVAFLDRGAGHPVVMLHCSTGSKGQWQAAMAEWADRYRLLALDLIGYGDSDPWRGERPLTLADEVEVVSAVTDQTDSPVHLVGHSYGGAVALHMALTCSAHVASLSLIEPTAFYLLTEELGHEPDTMAEIAGVANEVSNSLRAGFPMAAAHHFIDYWCGKGAWARLPSERRWQICGCMPKVEHDFRAVLSERTELSRLALIKAPTLILCGTDSPRPTRQISRTIAEAIPHARHRTLARAGHMLPLTHAETVNALVSEHIERALSQPPVETPTDRALSLHRHHGFEKKGVIEVEGAPPHFPMFRAARPA